MAEMQLIDIGKLSNARLLGKGQTAIEYLETDSRRIRFSERSLFIAIRGERHDGHNYLAELYSQGIQNFLVDTAYNSFTELPNANFIIANNTLEALQAIAGAYRKQIPTEVVAITGSNGKTMVKEWLFQCLASQMPVSRSPKSYNSQIGVPLSLWMINPEAKFALIEAGISQTGEMQKLANIILPEAGIFTTIGQAHQENFKNIEQKVEEKLRLFYTCKSLYYCLDHELIHQKICDSELLSGKELFAWSTKNSSATLFIEEVKKLNGKTELSVKTSDISFRLKIPFTDDASIENCIHVINFLLIKGLTEKQLQTALMGLTAVEMRLEQIKGIEACTLINDSYNSDINSLRIALDYLSNQKQHNKHALILSDIQQTGLSANELNRRLADMIASYEIDLIAVVGPEISRYPNLPASAHRFDSTEEFLSTLPSIELGGHAILIKGARKFAFEKIVQALSEKKHTTVLEINLNHLVTNLNYFRSLLAGDTKIMVMVKALSYGSGSYEIAHVLQHEQVDYLGVAFTDEGILLRERGIHIPVMVMSPEAESYEKLIEYNLEPEIFSFDGLHSFTNLLDKQQLNNYPIHLKIDTGMHRLGFLPKETDRLLEFLLKNPKLKIKSIFSHMAASDNAAENSFSRKQISEFNAVYEQFTARLGYSPMRHLLNSAGIERFPDAHFEMVRLGIGLHGISTQKKLNAVSTLKTRISQIKDLPAGDSIGYNRREVLMRDSRIAIIPIGYADGLDRKLGNRNGQMLVNARKVPIVGDVCMDMCMLDLTDVPAVEGDTVIVFGEQNSISELARIIDTIPYEILTNVSARVKRIYINE